MKAFFWLFNSPDRDTQEFLNAASLHSVDPPLRCVHGGSLVPGGFANSRLAVELASARATSQDELLLAIVHPRVDCVREVIAAAEDSLTTVALCSLEFGELRRPLPAQPPPRIVIVPESLPESAASDFAPFHGAVCDLIALLARIEVETIGNPAERVEKCSGIASLYASTLREARQQQRFLQAIAKAAAALTEDRVRQICCREHYDNAADFLKAARDFDRDGRLTWAGRVSGYHHSKLAPRFREAARVFRDPESARLEWHSHAGCLRAMLAEAFPFTFLDFARAASGQRVAAQPPEAVREILALIDDMSAALDRVGADTFAILESGMTDLSAKLSELRAQWYRSP